MRNVAADRSSRASWMTSSRLHAVLFALFCLLHSPGIANAQFTRFQNYGDEQGLDNLDTTAIKQDPAGYMLFGTQGGLYRFDGDTVSAYGESLGLPPAWIWQIAIDPFAHVWVVTRDNINILRDGRFVQLGDGSLFSNMEAPLLVAFGAGRVVINNGGALLTAPMTERDIGPFTPLLDKATLARLPQLRKTGFILATGPDSFAFGCGPSICTLSGHAVAVLSQDAGLPAEPWQTALMGPDGTLWARSLHHLAWRHPGASTFSFVDIPDRNANYFSGGPELLTMAADAQGGIYTQGEDGLLSWNGHAWRSMPHHLGGLAVNPIQALQFDREGSLWVGSNGTGVYRSIGLGHWEHWSTEDGLPGEMVWSTTRLPNGQFWVATYTGSTVLGDTSLRIPGTNCTLARTRGGRLWAAPFGSDLIRYDPADGRMERFASLGTVRTAFVDSRNRLWLSTRNGLAMVADADAPAPLVEPRMLLDQSTRQAVESPSGEIWAAASDGLSRLGADNRFHLVIGHDLLHARADGLQFAADGTLWAPIGGLGIARFRIDGDHVVALEMLGKPILPTNNVMFIFRDRRDAMWVGTDRGLEVLDHAGWHRIDSTIGPITNDLDAYGAYQDADGSMWFSTTRGLSHYLDPADLPSPPLLHPIVTGLSLDARALPAVPFLSVPASVGSLSVRFTDLDYAHGRGIAFRYRLLGVDRGWNETTAHEVRYANLPAGKLQFQLVAIDTMHGSSSPPTGFDIRVQAPWWQRWWFFLACLCCLFGLAAVLWRLRSRLLRRQQRRLFDEREQLERLVRLRTAEIEQARSELQRLAMTDALTGLPNRRAIMMSLDALIRSGHDNANSVGALLCDIDHFKTINDTGGHQAGDEVLAAFGARLQAIVPDSAGRYGGEEFLVILQGTSRAIEEMAQAVMDAIVDKPFRSGDIAQPVTASAGMAILRPSDTTATLIARADTALYRAKRNGRNRLERETGPRLQPAMSN